MHRLEFRADEMMDLDKTLCELHSLGSIITHVCYLERFTTDQAALPDMGRLVSEKANIALETIQASFHAEERTPGQSKTAY